MSNYHCTSEKCMSIISPFLNKKWCEPYQKHNPLGQENWETELYISWNFHIAKDTLKGKIIHRLGESIWKHVIQKEFLSTKYTKDSFN